MHTPTEQQAPRTPHTRNSTATVFVLGPRTTAPTPPNYIAPQPVGGQTVHGHLGKVPTGSHIARG